MAKKVQPQPSDNSPRIVIKKDDAIFQQGDIQFRVYRDDLERTLGAGQWGHEASVLDKLMDSQVISLAKANGLPVEPYVRELVRRPLNGIIQLVWYRDLQKYESDHLRQGQEKRVADYLRQLAEYKPDAETGKSAKRASKKAESWSHSFRIKTGAKPAKGRASQVYEVLKTFKDGATLADIVKASDGKVKTKQNLERIVMRFIKELKEDGCVEEVK